MTQISTSSFFKKLSLAKADFDPILKNKINSFFKDRDGKPTAYADLGSILEAIGPALDKHGLLLSQPILDGKVVSKIYDIDGSESIYSEIDLPQGLDAQKLGAAISYFRRFTLQSLLALSAEDDDGNSVVRPHVRTDPAIAYKAGVQVPAYVAQAPVAPYKATSSLPIAETMKLYPTHKDPIPDHAHYKPTFGKYKDRPLGEIGIDALSGYIKFLEQDPSKMSSGAIEFVRRAKEHLKSLVPKKPDNKYEPDSVPF